MPYLLERISLNDKSASELLLHGTIASKYHVPLVFVSGDFGICKEARSINPLMITHSAMQGIGNSTISIQPELSRLKIKKKAEQQHLQKEEQLILHLLHLKHSA